MSKSKYIVKEVFTIDVIAAEFLNKIKKTLKKTPFDKQFILFITDYEKVFRIEAVKQWKMLVRKININNHISAELVFFKSIYNAELNKIFWFYKYYATEYRYAKNIDKKKEVIQSLQNQKFLLGYNKSLDVVNDILHFYVSSDDSYYLYIKPEIRKFISIISFLEYVLESLSIKEVTVSKLIKFLSIDGILKNLKTKIPNRGAKYYTDFKSRNYEGWLGIRNDSIKNSSRLFGDLEYFQSALYNFLLIEKDAIRFDLNKPIPILALRGTNKIQNNLLVKDRSHRKGKKIK